MDLRRTAITPFPVLFLLFSDSLCHVHSAAVGADPQIRAAGGIPGPPGQPGQPGRNTPKKEGQETALPTTSYLSTSTVAIASTFAQSSSPASQASQTFISSFVSHPTSISTSSMTPTLSPASVLQESTLVTATFSSFSSSVPGTIPVIESASTTSSIGYLGSTTSPSSTTFTSFPSEWPATSPTTATIMPTNITAGSSGHSPDNRNLKIILPTVLLTIAFAIISILFVTRCCTRKLYVPSLRVLRCPKTVLPIPDEEILPSAFEKPQITRSIIPTQKNTITPQIVATLSRIFTRKSTHPNLSSPFPTETAESLRPPSLTKAPSFASARSFLGITLPSTAHLSPFPFSPLRSHPPATRGPPQNAAIVSPTPLPPTYLVSRHRPSFHRSSHVSLAASSSAVSSRSSKSGDSGVLPENFLATPARFTFGGVADGGGTETGWMAWDGKGETPGASSETERHWSERTVEISPVNRE